MIAEKHVKAYLGLTAIIGSLYGVWQIFEAYNADQLELKELDKKIVTVESSTAGAIQAVAAEAKANTLDVVLRMEGNNQNLQLHYNEVLEDCEAAKEDPETRDCSREKVQDAKEQLRRLGYNRDATVDLKKSVTGIDE